ncbi:MAG: 3-methyl-2-oxobutanoate hydroxymethyltransferase [Chlamydiales bacterium]|jgi:3-methyl-2-oxobutanoate hydroxymethyltransferase
MNIQDFQKMKLQGEKISMVTCYDYWSARIISQSDVNCILVGDSLSMVMHGHPSTISATVEMMALHTEAVARGADKAFIIGDLPFLSYRKGLSESVDAVHKIMQSGAHAIKLEGAIGNLSLIEHLVASGVPVMGHLGLTPQSVHQLGGYRVQGKDEDSAKKILKHAQELENAGCFALVLECVPSDLAQEVTEALNIPTIGIGAGVEVSGQVLVLHDLLGLNTDCKPKFLKTYYNGSEQVLHALNSFSHEVKNKIYPAKEHCY